MIYDGGGNTVFIYKRCVDERTDSCDTQSLKASIEILRLIIVRPVMLILVLVLASLVLVLVLVLVGLALVGLVLVLVLAGPVLDKSYSLI